MGTDSGTIFICGAVEAKYKCAGIGVTAGGLISSHSEDE